MQEENKVTQKSKSNVGYIIVIVMLLIALGVVVYSYRGQMKRLAIFNEQIEAQRDTLGARLTRMIAGYDSVKTKNDDLKAELDREKKKIRALIRKMYNVEQMNLETIQAYERETNTLRAIMRNYIRQIDSLNTLSQHLIAENKEVKQALQASQEENKELVEHKTQLEAKMQKASVLKISSLMGGALNSSDKEVTNASRAKKLKGCFTINENLVVEHGVRIIYVRFLNPEKGILLTEGSGTMTVGGEELQYSSKREIDFQGEALETCIYYTIADGVKLTKGQYEVQVYVDGKLAGSAAFTLKGFLF